jgi:hypothetical protein
MTYSELLFRQKSVDRIYPDQARKLVAAACDGLDIDPAIFNRDGAGKTLSGTYGAEHAEEGFGIPPRIVFDGGAGFIRIYGIGRAGAKTLENEAPKLFSALYKQGFMGFDQKSGAMSIARREQGGLYGIRCLVLARKPGACKPFVKAPLQGDVAGLVSEIMLRGLSGVARMLDNELIDAKLPPVFEQAIPQQVDMVEGEPIPVLIKPGIWGAAYKDMLVSMPCKLNGPWATGLLRSRGYGLIRAVNPTRGE